VIIYEDTLVSRGASGASSNTCLGNKQVGEALPGVYNLWSPSAYALASLSWFYRCMLLDKTFFSDYLEGFDIHFVLLQAATLGDSKVIMRVPKGNFRVSASLNILTWLEIRELAGEGQHYGSLLSILYLIGA
jgi:hypothetical protein